MSENQDLINEYKDQVRILKQEVAELQDAGKSKDAANKRCLQKLEHSQQDLELSNIKIKEFFEQFQQLPSWFTNLWILVVASIYGIKGTQIFRGGVGKDKK